MINIHILLQVIELKNKNYFLIFSVIVYTFLLLLFSSPSIQSSKAALDLCARSLIPSLFPFFVCSNLLINLGGARLFSNLLTPLMRPLFGLGGSCGLPMLLGYISGYPIGAKTAADLYLTGGCTKSEAEKLLAFCNNSGPMFIIGAVGSGMLGNRHFGFILYFSHILSSLIVALCMRPLPVTVHHSGKSDPSVSTSGFGEVFTSAISSAVLLTLNVCGFVIMFATVISFADSLGFIDALASLGLDPSLSRAIIYGFFECSGGCSAAIMSVKSPLLLLMLLSAVIAWSGISVHLQVLGIIKKAKLSPKLYFKGKALMAIISPLITFIIYSVSVSGINPLPVVKMTILVSIAYFAIYKITAIIKQLHSRYAALPPK